MSTSKIIQYAQYLLECQSALSNIQLFKWIWNKNFNRRGHRGRRVAMRGSDLIHASRHVPISSYSNEYETKIQPRKTQSCKTAYKPALIPYRHCLCPIVPLWYLALKVCVFKRVVFCLNREPLDAGFCGRCFWERETSEDTVDLKPEVVVVVGCVVFLDYEYLGHGWLLII